MQAQAQQVSQKECQAVIQNLVSISMSQVLFERYVSEPILSLCFHLFPYSYERFSSKILPEKAFRSTNFGSQKVTCPTKMMRNVSSIHTDKPFRSRNLEKAVSKRRTKSS
jgi:hypothetical protein